jgi:hypothetical protein
MCKFNCNTATKTAKDARDRIDVSRAGSLANNPSLDYLYALVNELESWLHMVDRDIEMAIRAEKK